MQRWTATCCKGASSSTIKRSILTWSFSWHYGGMKEDALQEGLPLPDEAAVRERVLRKNVEAPDLATVKDFLRFHAATSKGKIQEEQILFQKLLANFLHIHQCQIIVKV